MNMLPGFMKNKKILIFPPLLIGAAAIFFAPVFKSKPAQVLTQEKAVKVRVLNVSPLNVIPRALGYGVVMPGATWDGVAEVAGQVVWLSDELKDGQTVPAGTPLLRIEDADYRLALAQADAQLQSAGVKLENTRSSVAIAEKDFKLLQDDYERKQTLLKKGAVSKSNAEAAQRQMLNGQTQLQNLKNTLKTSTVERQVLVAQKTRAELDLKRTEFVAPFDVRITDVKIGEAQYANKGQQLFTADGLNKAEVEAQFPVGILRPLISAVTADPENAPRGVLALEAIVRLRTPTHTVEWPARVERASGTIDPQTQSIGVVVAIDHPSAQAKPGQRPPLLRNTFVEVELIAPQMDKKVVVPSLSIHQGKVYVVDDENRLDIRKVNTVFSQKGFTVLKGGVKPGEKVVTSDLPTAIKGMLLDPQEDKKSKRQLIIEATGKEPQK